MSTDILSALLWVLASVTLLASLSILHRCNVDVARTGIETECAQQGKIYDAPSRGCVR